MRLFISMGKFDTSADKTIQRLSLVIAFEDQQYMLLTSQLT